MNRATNLCCIALATVLALIFAASALTAARSAHAGAIVASHPVAAGPPWG
jgi:hypothetical protein